MDSPINVQPLPQKRRHHAFIFLVCVFVLAIPFLYMYATGYRFDVKKPTTLVSTGGMYIGVDLLGAEIYVDNELMRETRTFRRAFYAQGLDAGTHRVHVQKEGYHTWVKELPVSKRLVTEAEAFNFPLVPRVRVISPLLSATGSAVVMAPLLNATSTNELLATTTKKSNSFSINEEYHLRLLGFATTSTSITSASVATQLRDIIIGETATSTESESTTTVTSQGVELRKVGEEVYATWVGPFEQMPYYYCAEDFPPYTEGLVSPDSIDTSVPELEEDVDDREIVMHPVQTVPKDVVCEPTIRIARNGELVHDFNFFPGSTDLVLMVLDSGLYVTEVDDRGWQNVQPLFLGENVRMYTDNGLIYVYDGTLIYQIVTSID